MRVLLASLGVPGLLAPTISVARVLRDDGHDVAFVTNASAAALVEAERFRRIPFGEGDDPSFQIESWGNELNIALQVKHLEYALERFGADALCASHLALGPALVREQTGLPLAIIGSLVLLWDPAIHIDGTRGPQTWRYDEMAQALASTRALLGLPPGEGSALLGDVWFLQGVAALQSRAPELPPYVRFAGSCIEKPLFTRLLDAQERRWFDDQRRLGRPVLFVQLGRTFGRADWAREVMNLLDTLPVAYALARGRYEERLALDSDRAILVRDDLAVSEVMRRADAAIVSGQPAATLAAIEAALPISIVACGSGTEEIGDALSAFGSGVRLDAECSAEDLRKAVERMLDDSILRERARELARAYAVADGPRAVADTLLKGRDAALV